MYFYKTASKLFFCALQCWDLPQMKLEKWYGEKKSPKKKIQSSGNVFTVAVTQTILYFRQSEFSFQNLNKSGIV